MTPTQAEAIKTLTEAKRLVTRHWVQGELEDTRYKKDEFGWDIYEKPVFTAYCAWGALNKADGPGEALAKRFLTNAIRLINGKKSIPRTNRVVVFTYNDKEGRNKKEVVAAFDKAIELAQVEEGS